MKDLSLLQKIAVYTGLISALTFGAYRCGNDVEPNPDGQEDAQVEVDSGYDSGGLEDKLIYPDANGDDVPNGDIYQPDTDVKDGGLDASDVNITDVPHYDGGDVDLTDVLDGGYDANDTGGDTVTDVGDAGQGIPPVVIMETRDEQGNFKGTFKRGEYVVWDLNKSYDPDCSDKGTCGTSKGMDYCDWWDEFGNAGKIYFPDFGKGVSKISYGSPKDTVTATTTCYDLDDKLSSTTQVTINLID